MKFLIQFRGRDENMLAEVPVETFQKTDAVYKDIC